MKLKSFQGGFLFEDLIDKGVYAGFTDNSYAGALGFEFQQLVSLKQVHSNKVVRFQGNPNSFTADGVLTFKEKVMLTVRTADCLPVFVFDSVSKAVGIIHLGWKPARVGIIKSFFGAAGDDISGENLWVGIGPGLRGRCFEVGEEFLEIDCFRNFLVKYNSGYWLDLARFAKAQFVSRGVRRENIIDSGICSLCSDKFFSYRRNKTEKRTLNFITKCV